MEKKRILKITLLSAAAAILFICLASAAAAFAISQSFENKIFPGIKIVDIKLGGKTKTEAKSLLETALSKTFLDKGATFFADGEKITIQLNNGNDILKFNYDAMVEKAFDFGRNGNRFKNQWQRLAAPLVGHRLPLDYQFNKDLLKDTLSSQLKSKEQPFNDADISIKILDETTKNVETTIITEQAGASFNYLSGINKYDENIKNAQNTAITLEFKKELPIIHVQDVAALLPDLQKFIQSDKHALAYKDAQWEIPWNMFVQWLSIRPSLSENPAISLDDALVKNYLTAIAQNVDQEPKDAKFQIQNNKVIEFQASEKGRKLDIDKTFEVAVETFINKNGTTAQLVVKEIDPRVSMQDINDLGIKELVGVGISNYAGSPPNRIHNIGVGSASLNGLLIKPGEEFSINNALGDVDASTGYLQEMVIKQNKTVPEYGGGLCQIATTVFRVALASGLPITERRPHSYRVGYYEPAGLDATIYSPHPDVKFLNDTGNYLLLQTKITGTIVRFELWGTKDSRKVSFEGANKTDDLSKLKTVIYNITDPAPTKEVETDTLAPGQKKCIEIPHKGADAYFYRMVEWSEESAKQPIKEKWTSHYVPWQAVCLIGVDPTKKVAEAQTATEQPPANP